MISVIRTMRQKLPSTLMAAASFSSTSVKSPTAKYLQVKLVDLHESLHDTKEPELQLRGLRLHDAIQVPSLVTSTVQSAFSNHGSTIAQIKTPMEFRSMPPSSTTSFATDAKQTISALISQSAEIQINKIRAGRGRLQDKYLYSMPTSKSAKTVNAKPMSTATSAAVTEIGKDVAASVFGNKVKKAQRTMCNEDLQNAFDL